MDETLFSIDGAASLARTALTDPLSLPLGEGVYAPGSDLLPSPSGSATFYAVSRLDEIIEALNPSADSAAGDAGSLRCLGAHVAEVRARCDARFRAAAAADCEERGAPNEEAAASLEQSLDRIDDAIRWLTGEGDD